MKVSDEFIKELEKLYSVYEDEVKAAEKQGALSPTTSRTYLVHAYDFVKWCRDDFEPGMRKKR